MIGVSNVDPYQAPHIERSIFFEVGTCEPCDQGFKSLSHGPVCAAAHGHWVSWCRPGVRVRLEDHQPQWNWLRHHVESHDISAVDGWTECLIPTLHFWTCLKKLGASNVDGLSAISLWQQSFGIGDVHRYTIPNFHTSALARIHNTTHSCCTFCA